MVFTNLSAFPVLMSPVTNISPLTYRDASTFLEQLTQLSEWLEETLVPETNTALANAVTEMQAAISNAENTTTAALQEWNGRFDQYSADLSAQVAAVQDAAVKVMVENAAGPTGTAIRALIPDLTPLNTSMTQAETDIDTLQTDVTELETGKVAVTEKGAANGVATLDAGSKIPNTQLPAPSGSGNLSARPAADTVPEGFTYYALDTRETYRRNGAAWVSVGKGGRLGSASIVTTFETTSTALVDVTGLAVTFTAGSGIAKITLSGEASQTVNDGSVILVIEVNGEDSGHVPITFPTANTSSAFTRVVEKTTLIAGNVYTAKVKMLVGAAGGFGKLNGETYNPVTLLVESV